MSNLFSNLNLDKIHMLFILKENDWVLKKALTFCPELIKGKFDILKNFFTYLWLESTAFGDSSSEGKNQRSQ